MNIKKLFFLVLIALFIIGSPTADADTSIPPKPTTSIYVQDHAGVLSGTSKRHIQEIGQQLAAASKAQIVVVTVPTIGASSLEEYANTLFRQWGIGDKNLNNGVLLLIAVNDRQSRIEVGYGLEGALPDGKTKLMSEKLLIPHLKNGDFNSGIVLLYRELARTTAAEYKVTDKIPALSSTAQAGGGTAKPSPPANESNTFFDYLLYIIGGLILLVIFILNPSLFFAILQVLLSSRGGGGGGRGGGGGFGGGSSGGGGSSSRW